MLKLGYMQASCINIPASMHRSWRRSTCQVPCYCGTFRGACVFLALIRLYFWLAAEIAKLFGGGEVQKLTEPLFHGGIVVIRPGLAGEQAPVRSVKESAAGVWINF